MPLDPEWLADLVVKAIADAQIPLLARIAALEAAHVSLDTRLSVPGRDGRDGTPGAAGRDGERGRDGVDGKAGAPGIDGKDGAPGIDGSPGRDGVDGIAGVAGKDGRDGINGKDGAPGPAGQDGTLDHLELTQSDDFRTVTATYENGERMKTWVFTFPVVIDRGVFQRGTTYGKGDAVSWGGSLWIAQADTDATPDEGHSPWRLAAKRGREGRQGPPGPAGPTGKDGRDWSQVDSAGRGW